MQTIKTIVSKFKSGDSMDNKMCSSCGSHVMSKDNFVQFGCPECGKGKITRCKTCKDLSNRYKCAECDFVGP